MLNIAVVIVALVSVTVKLFYILRTCYLGVIVIKVLLNHDAQPVYF